MSEHHEIVIIKRHSGGHEDEHHGGVWKIAFADFMTAMMAFFLVMWLISANDKTKAVIARYFNPVQLVDSTPQPKGLEDPKPGSPSVMPKAAAPAPEAKDTKPDGKPVDGKTEAKTPDANEAEAKDEAKAPDGPSTSPAKDKAPKPGAKGAAEAMLAEKRDEAALFRDPYAVLAEIAGKSTGQPTPEMSRAATNGEKGGAGAIGRHGGEAYRDPFEPLPVKAGPMVDSLAQDSQPARPDEKALPRPSTPDQAGRGEQPGPVAQNASPAASNPGAAGKPSEIPVPRPADAAPTAAPLATRIETALREAAAAAPAGGPHVDVHHTNEGTVIDLTDGANFAMFASASARPSPTTLALMEKIAHLLQSEKGLVTIRGFTDARPFRSDTYDNWRLSSARAHMAHYMLVRGGLDEQRVERIEGYADRQLKNPKDPNAAENRRIEILLRSPAP